IDATTPVTIATAAMLRWIAAERSTKVTPVATTAKVATCIRMLRRLTTSRKASVVAPKNTTSATSVANGASLRARLAHTATTDRGLDPIRGADGSGAGADGTGEVTRSSSSSLSSATRHAVRL